MVAKYKNQNIHVNGQEIEAYDCDIDGDGNIITGEGNRIRGNKNTIFGCQESVEGDNNMMIDDQEAPKKKIKKKKLDQDNSDVDKKGKKSKLDEDDSVVENKKTPKKSKKRKLDEDDSKVENKKTSKKIKKKKKSDEDYAISDIRSVIKKHLESIPGDFGPGGLKLIPKKREEEVKDENVELLYCKLCRDKIVRVLCGTCNHLCMCISCSRKIGGLKIDPTCPICKKKITLFTEVYLT